MKYLLSSIVLILCSCATLTPTQGVLLTDAVTLAQIAGTAAAATYGGPAAGEAASAGLDALGSVAEGYIAKKIPTAVIVATPGIGNLGQVAASVISTKGTVTQADVNTIFQAAAIAAKSTTP